MAVGPTSRQSTASLVLPPPALVDSTPSPSYSAPKDARQKPRNEDSDEEDDDCQPVASSSNTTDARCETIRKQRIESDQRRCNELRLSAVRSAQW